MNNEVTTEGQLSPKEAIEQLKKSSQVKFDESVEVHVVLGVDKEKSEQNVRGTVAFPHDIGKKVRLIAFVDPANETKAKEAGADLIGSEQTIEEIMKTKKVDFDVAVAEPAAMRKIGKIAKILGPKGLMPNPKTGTVGQDIIGIIKDIKGGKVSFKMDAGGNVHQMLGKLSLDIDKLAENLEVFMETLRKLKPETMKGELIKKVVLTSTMGKGIRIKA